MNAKVHIKSFYVLQYYQAAMHRKLRHVYVYIRHVCYCIFNYI